MKQIYFALILLSIASQAMAGYGSGDINRYYVRDDGWVYFGLITQLPNTCSSWGEHFRFDATTPGGKNMLGVIMAAKASNKRVDVWYTDSASPGTDQTTGCTGSAMAILKNIGIR